MSSGEPPGLNSTLDYDRVRQLRPEARKRGRSVGGLALELLDAVVADNLVSAVLDTDEDVVEPGAAPGPAAEAASALGTDQETINAWSGIEDSIGQD